MDRLNLLLLVLWWCSSCTPRDVDDPPTTTTIPPSTTTTSQDPHPPPEELCELPDVGRGERECYITRTRAGVRRAKPVLSSGLLRDMMFADQELISTSRNFLGASQTCREHLGKTALPFLVTPTQLAALAVPGFRLHDGGREIGESRGIVHPSMLSFIGELDGLGRLQRSHHNCPDDDDETNPWCGRTGVFQPLIKDFREGVAAHMNAMRAIDRRANHLGFDGLRAWCEVQQ